MQQSDLIPHLFRTEAGKITAVLSKAFGLSNLEAAEDITSETFLTALETWPYNGVPPNPTAWLYTVARNKARNYLQRASVFTEKVSSAIQHSEEDAENAIDLSDNNIADSQLRMLFALCHPSIPQDAQIALSLRILCGFGVDEIANALLSTKEAINKKMFRAREKLRSEEIILDLPGEDIGIRLTTVLRTIYLLFNEGYYSESNDKTLREDLCMEAINLTHLLSRHTLTNTTEVSALLALMYFHSSRFPARRNERNQNILYYDQDDTLWNRAFISRGVEYLHASSTGNNLSRYHLEATIAYWHTVKPDTIEKWENILQLYNYLLVQEYSPVAALNRTFALSKVKGKEAALMEAKKLQLESNHYYFVLLGELYTGLNSTEALRNFEQALALARTTADRQSILDKINNLRADNRL